LTESLVLSFLGGGLGLLLAAWSRDALWSLRPPELSETLRVAIDARVLAFTFGLCVLTALTFGLIPALQLSRPSLVSALKGAEPFGSLPKVASRARRLLVAFQVALSLVLVSGAALFLRSLGNAENVDPGFSVDHHLVFAFDLGSLDYDSEHGQQFYQQAVQRIDAIPGVESAAIGESLELYPSALGYWLRPVVLENGPKPSGSDVEMVQSNTVGETYFRTVGMTLLSGRAFDDQDRAGHPRVVVVNQTLAERFWPEASPLGKKLRFQGEEEPLQVVGVVADARYNSLGEGPKPYLYLPLRQEYTTPVFMHVRTRRDAAALLPAVRKVMGDLNANLGLGFTLTMRQVFDQSLWAPRLGATLLLAFGVLALGLAGLGIYGIVSHSLQQRRRELSVRMALGAERSDLLVLMLKQGLILALVGVVFGLFFSLEAGRLARSYLFGLQATDLGILGGASGVLLFIALLANLLAAFKIFIVKPHEVLEIE
jgi:predicted permease